MYLVRDSNAILLSGYAKLPSNITAEAVFGVLAIAVLFDKRSGVIIEAEASMVTDLSKRFVAELMKGYNLSDGPDQLIAQFEECYLGSSKKALETAIRSIFTKYEEYRATRG
jgi:hypothetical protein